VILHALEESYSFIQSLDSKLQIDKFELTTKLKDFCDFFNKNRYRTILLQKETIERANLLLNISNKTKLVFAGYVIEDLSPSFDEILNKIFADYETVISDRVSNNTIHTKILKTPGKTVQLTSISKKYRTKRDHIIKAMNDLSNHGLGSIQEKQVGRKKQTFFFKNCELDEKLTKSLNLFDLSLEEYVKSLQTSTEEEKEFSK
jgi:hypothetical protein